MSHLQTMLQEKQSRNALRQHYVLLQATWEQAVELFPPRSVDTVFLTDVIEHLEKEDGRRLLTATEAIVQRQIVVFTPLGFMMNSHPPGVDAWGMDGVSWQEHRSGWMPEDFDETWKTIGCKEFHLTEHDGEKYEKPHGAFWAIKTQKSDDDANARIILSRRQKMHLGLDQAINRMNAMRKYFRR